MNALKAVGVALLTFILASTSGSELLYHISYSLVAVLSLCLAWSLSGLGWLRVTRETRSLRAQVGDMVEERLTATNSAIVPKLWLEVRDHSDLPGHQPGRVVSLGPMGRSTWLTGAVCRRRGEYRLGPLTLSSSDPFGFFRWTRRGEGSRSLLVYPATVSLPGFVLPSGDLLGGATSRQGPQQAIASASGTREYVPGDSLNRIHWPSTARAQKLIVKEFEFDPTSEVWIFLDLQAAAHWGSDDDSTEEYSVTVAASLTRRLLDLNRSVGLVATSRLPVIVPMDRGPRQLIRVLERLAVVRANGYRPLAEALITEASRLARSTTAIVVTSSLDSRWPSALKQATHRGARAIAVLIDPHSFGGQGDSGDLTGALASIGVPEYVLKRDDNLSIALAGQARSNGRATLASRQ